MSIEKKVIGGNIVEFKQEERNGVPVGIVAGYIATWDIDRGDDQFTRGAFIESIMEHKSKNRPVRLKKGHMETIGGFPIDTVREDERGLFGIGEINLETQEGKEAFSLAKQGVLTDFSIGFSVVDFEIRGGLRVINKAKIWEGSIVDEPMNTRANITEVKSILEFSDYPIAPSDYKWDAEEAEEKANKYLRSGAFNEKNYQDLFLVNTGNTCRLQIADKIDGKIYAIPEAIRLAAKQLKDLDLEASQKSKAIQHLEKYYAKMDSDSPFEDGQFFTADQVKAWDKREIESRLIKTGAFSKSAAKILVSKLDISENVNQTSDFKENHIPQDTAKSILEELSFLKTKIA